ncbi:MAG: hypothetical protein ABR499_20480 [Gemmatimonadaceae bacterium]
MNSLICEAIRKMRLLMFGYGDFVRVVEPHMFGVNSAGHEMLSAWLRPGHSRSDPDGGWRNYLTSDITNLQMLDETFARPREGFNAADPRMREIYCQLGATGAAVAARPDESR